MRGTRFIHRLKSWATWGLVGVALVVFTPVTEWLGRPLYLPASSPSQKVDAIVILEAWATEAGELNESGVNRVLRGADWYRAGAAPVVLLTGLGPVPSRENSALRPMTELLVQLGVPRHAIEIEAQSSNTHESAVHVAELARRRNWTGMALVTDASHMPRASMAFRKAGIARIERAPTLWWDLGAAQPAVRFKRVNLLLHEYGGLLYYWWRGWLDPAVAERHFVDVETEAAALCRELAARSPCAAAGSFAGIS